MDVLFAIVMATLAYSSVSAGMVLMKKGIDWLGWKGSKGKLFYKNFFIWVLGFIIMNLYGIPSAIALKVLPAHVVSAFAGWGIVAVIVFSAILLKEKISGMEMVYSGLIVMGIVLINVIGTKDSAERSPDIIGLVLVSLLPILVISIHKLVKQSRFSAALWAGVAGASAGMMVVYLKLLIGERGYSVSEYFSCLWFWLYVFFALLSFIAIQVACKKGDMVTVGPVQYCATILWPLFAAFVVFGEKISVLQLFMFMIITASVFSILKKRSI